MNTRIPVVLASILACTLGGPACSPVSGGFETPLTQSTPGALIGRLLAADGSPVANLDVVLRQGELRQTVRTGLDGRFAFEAPPLGAVELAGHDGAGHGFFVPVVLEAAGLNDLHDVRLAPIADLVALTTFPGLGLEERVSAVEGRCTGARRAPDGLSYVCLRSVGDAQAMVVTTIDVATGAETVVAEVSREALEGYCPAEVLDVRGRVASLMLPRGSALVDLTRRGPGAFVTGYHYDPLFSSRECYPNTYDVSGSTLRALRWGVGVARIERPDVQLYLSEVRVDVKVVEYDLDAPDLSQPVREAPVLPSDVGVFLLQRTVREGFVVSPFAVAVCEPNPSGSATCHGIGDRLEEIAAYEREMVVVRAAQPQLLDRIPAPWPSVFGNGWVLTNDATEVWMATDYELRISEVSTGAVRVVPLGPAAPYAYDFYAVDRDDQLLAVAWDVVGDAPGYLTFPLVAEVDRSTTQLTQLPGFLPEVVRTSSVGEDGWPQPSLAFGPTIVDLAVRADGDRAIVVRNMRDTAQGQDPGPPYVQVSKLDFDGTAEHERYAGAYEEGRGPLSLVSSPDGLREAMVAVDPVSGRAQIFEGPRGGPIDALPQRTFLRAEHQAPSYSSDGRWLYFWAEDPATNYPQLFRLETQPSP